MPRKRTRSGRRRRRRAKTAGGNAGKGGKLQAVTSTTGLASLPDIHLALTSATALAKRSRSDSKEFELVEHKERPGSPPEDVYVALKLLRAVFKPDLPYRTQLGGYGTVATSAAGVLNYSASISGITSFSQWAGITALFDEVFIHSMRLAFQPVNAQGGGGVNATPGVIAGQVTVSTAVSAAQATAVGVVICSLFSAAGTYGTAAAMLNNPTHKTLQSNLPWVYTWRNNVRFDPRGVTLSGASSEAWNGWNWCTNAGNMGGSVQMRAANDYTLGDTTHVFTAGVVAITFDVSFRARA